MDGSSDPRDIYNLFFGSDAVEEEAREEKAFAFAASSMATYVNSIRAPPRPVLRRNPVIRDHAEAHARLMPGDNEDVIEEQVDEDDTDDENPNEGAGDEDDDD
ncbi:hypothetical protein QVD17_17299 [Tagetes erecta]|uniref:Uncharacterized protein n=1 Tax=Tagetes erecta TaxID=13708 RepID=A0AAD8P1B1_TARER|nr:hypothetical protein QVD17_17299 [Tagetes erecta]